MIRRKKLIEVALPLDELNAACKADKDRKIGTLRNISKWFAPMPLPAWRALLFAALVDDPEDDNKRLHLLDVTKRLVENGADLPDEDTLEEARAILRRQFADGLPTVMDPFCGGGTTLVEAQRLGLPSFGSDLNPVPALISRTLTEILPAVRGAEPLHSSESGALFRTDSRVEPFAGFASDVRYYGGVVKENVNRALAGLYPARSGETPIAWMWARTAPCPNPACGCETVLTTSWWLSRNRGDLAWIEPRRVGNDIHLAVVSGQRSGAAPEPPKIGRGASFACLACGQPISEDEIRKFGESGRLGVRMTAVAVEIGGRRHYRQPTHEEVAAAASATIPEGLPDISLGPANQYVAPPRYGLTTHLDLYTPRQLVLLETFAGEIAATHSRVLEDGGSEELAVAVTTILALALGKLAQYGSSQTRLVTYTTSTTRFNSAFARNDLPMIWDFYEANVFGAIGGTWDGLLSTCMSALPYVPGGVGSVQRGDARSTSLERPGLIATDPPYFDAIGYADLADYFYLWHRRALRHVHPDLYGTIATPKEGELTAFPWHHGGTREAARAYFIAGFTETFRSLCSSLAADLPMVVVYASKEQKGGTEEETRWSSILTAMIDAELEITGTWPIHGTGSTRMRGIGANAVASYIVMTCRPRAKEATSTSLSEFARVLRRELAPAIRDLQAASILPVDLAQAAMGPGMQVFSRYRAVLDQSGRSVGVGQALRLINSALSEVLDEQEGELDAESRFAIRWWQAHGWTTASFGDADKTARPLGIGVDDVVRAQVATSQANKVQLLGAGPLDRRWRPSTDVSPTAWEAVHHLADRLVSGGGELEAARLMAELGSLRDPAMALVYRLHDIAAKKGWTADQERYNALISSWTELVRIAGDGNESAEGLF
ncbi:DUF1156 domain-containing protein [Nocardioides agariphilus]|nr:DUF1156 domain-containing protein [Nocardioides agariphilus]